jgi:23S rRNA pseudouridine2457 synthase
MMRYVLFNKPYGVLSQFSPQDGVKTLSDFNLPKEIYPAGRLDKDSEGLLLLTNDGPLIDKLLNPLGQKVKTYWVLVERIPTEESLQKFRSGLKIEDYITKKCEVQILEPQPEVPARIPPVRVRKTVTDIWLEVKLTEGKNRQVRKMTAAIGHPTLRLMGVGILNLNLHGIKEGEWREIKREEIFI